MLLHPETEVPKEYIDSKLMESVIVQSKSPLVSPVILVLKSSSKLCVCVDYKRLKNITETNNYPLFGQYQIFYL